MTLKSAALAAAPHVGVYPVFLMKALCFALFAAAFNLLFGQAGLLSFGHAAFWGTSAYTAGLIAVHSGLPFPVAVLGGATAAMVLALPIGYLSVRRTGIYFAMVTLALSQCVYYAALEATDWTGGENGLSFSRPQLGITGIYTTPFTSTTLHWFVLAIVAVSYIVLRRITQSPFGMVLQSIRENEARTRAIGYPVQRYKIVAVMLSGLFAGLAGVLYAIQNRFAAPDFVYFLVSGETVIFNVMGGIGTLVGPIVGAAFFLLLRETFSRFFTEFYLIPVGAIFIAMVIFMPQGLLGFARRWLNR